MEDNSREYFEEKMSFFIEEEKQLMDKINSSLETMVNGIDIEKEKVKLTYLLSVMEENHLKFDKTLYDSFKKGLLSKEFYLENKTYEDYLYVKENIERVFQYVDNHK